MTSKTLIAGTPCLVICPAPSGPYHAQFEDDGTTGYFYGLDTRLSAGERVVAALHVYNVETLAHRNRPAEIEIRWARDGTMAALVVNREFRAVLDFAARRGYCRTNLPAPNTAWTNHDYAWDDRVTTWFG